MERDNSGAIGVAAGGVAGGREDGEGTNREGISGAGPEPPY